MQDTARTPTPERGSPSPLEALGRRWEEASRRRLNTLIARHGAALTPVEREVFTPSPDAPSGSNRDLRRALIRRLLRAATYRRRGAALASTFRLRAASFADETPAGPYNSFMALEQTIRRVAAAHPEWVAEFLDVYGGMEKIRKVYGDVGGKK